MPRHHLLACNSPRDIPRVKIPLKSIISFVKENTKEPRVEITEIAKLSIDI